MRWVLLLLLAVAACGSKHDAPAAGSGGSGSAVAKPAGLAVFVDGKQVATVSQTQLAAWPRVDQLVPVEARRLGRWQDLELVGAKPKPTDMASPSATYPDLVPAVFPGEGGDPAFGMFDPVELAKHGKPVVRQDGITEVRIALAQNSGRGQNETGAGGGGDPTKLELTIKTAKGEQVVKGDALLATARQAMPGGDGEAKGWPLSLILENAGVKAYKRVRLSGESGSSVTLEKQDLDPKTSVPFVKLNRQGQLRFRVFKKQGESWQPGPDLRGLTKIEVLE